MGSHWRYATVAPDYEELQRELGALSYLRMREDETYYAYARRLELLVERATELRESALRQRARAGAETFRRVFDLRDIPSSSTRPPTGAIFPHFPPTLQTSRPVFSPQTLHSPYSSPRPVSSPRPELSPHYSPRVPVERPLGLYARGPPVIPRDSAGFELSPSRLEYSTWGYTDIASSSEDEREPTWTSVGSGYRVGGYDEQLRRRDGGRTEVVAGMAEMGEGSAAVAESAASTSVLEVWVPESPVVEVVVISSAEEIAEGEPEEDGISEEDSEMTDTVTTVDSLGDPDYTVGS